MDIATLTTFLGWSTLINMGILIYWFMVILLARGWIREIHTRWFHLSEAQFDVIHYGGMGLYKILIIVFNLVPWLVLRFIF